ncbi:YhdP family protein [Undibacterium aquatile]|uniref:TIGR02099 family protein n=1 Tax=Undibacterium aquatile TaxID=1537398 RepID=A0ABR6XGD9_9BURK|nr:YhdP family protein [Undibacterium aquatile]MBC3811967.1 TIGR02099 family protein [Undibacterium aquatile]
MKTDIPASQPSAAEDQEPVLPARSRWRRLSSHTFAACGGSIRFVLRAALLLYFVFCILVLVLRYLVLPHVADYKPEVEAMVSRAIGRELHMASLQASWQGFNPQLVLQNVEMLDQHGKAALRLPEVRTTLSWWSLALLDLRFDKIELHQPVLDIQRDADGKLYIGGFFIDPKKKSDGKGLDWVLAQHQIVIKQGLLRWNDQARNAPELQLKDVSLILRNRWQHHQFALRATPPAALTAPVDIRGDLQHPPFSRQVSDFSNWSGELYADLQSTDLHALRAYIDYPADISQGYGAVRSWLRLDRGRVADVSADLKLADVQGKFAKDLPELDMAEIRGRVTASEKADLGKKYLPSLFGKAGHTIALTDFYMKARDGAVMPATTIRESFTPGIGNQPAKVELYAKFLDLQILANFAGHLPLPADQRQMLADFAPKGQLKEFSASWQGTYPDVAAYKVNGEFINLSMQPQPAQLARAKTAKTPAKAAVPAIPGFENLSGTVDASDRGGAFSLDSKDLSLRLASYFIDPVMPFNRLQMQANWKFQADDKLMFQINRMDMTQESMHATLSGKHIMSMRASAQPQPGDVDLTAHIDGFDLKQLDRYIPTVAEPDLRHWLTKSILDGRADDVTVRIRGDLAHFPFSASEPHSKNKGEFLVRGNLTGGKLDFTAGELAEGGKAPLWPVIDDIKGNFIFERARMEINGDTAKTLGADLRKVKAVIPDLLSAGSVLNIDGNASGQLQTMLAYVSASPVDGWLGHFLAESKASATAGLTLKLQLPLRHMIDAKVNGVLQFANNDVVLQPGIPLVTGVNGKLEFNERGVNLGTLKGTALGGPIVISGGSQKDNSIRVRLDGSVTGEGLRQMLPAANREQIKIDGTSRYIATIAVKKQLPEIVIESNLQGMALNFPAPLKKGATEAMPLRIELVPQINTDTSVLQDELRIHLGNAVHAKYVRQKSTDKQASWQLLRGGIGVNVPAPEPLRGVAVNIESNVLHVDEWRSVLNTGSAGPAMANNNTATSALNGAAGKVVQGVTALNIAPYLDVSTLALKTGQLHIMGKQLDHVVMGVSHHNDLWQANIDANQVSGHISWNDGSAKAGAAVAGPGSVTARLSKLIIQQSAASDTGDLFDEKRSSTQIPGLDIVADNVELFNKKLGRLELQASNQMSGASSEWLLSKVLLKNPDAELRATGRWGSRTGNSAGNSVTQLNYVLDIANAGQLLDRLGFANVVRGGRGRLDGDVKWNGLPYAMDIPSMSGKVQLDLAAGQFLKVDPGAAKLLGVLSMQSLPRRLTLDFRDIFSEGFAFDAITGSAQILQGVARTDNLKMRGVNATVVMAGNADIVNESQQLHVVVIPVINAGAASVVYGLAVNPVIGLGTFLAQLFLREPLAKAFTFEYMVSGPWKDPLVKKIERQENQDVAGEHRVQDAKKGE